ncbi:MAG: dienelactone hydrolase family protein [Proteobacteria bacterium]|nr:dienelactone hydrolase family protein [Pseudomonadota bacterium]MDA1057764.1 dienelactone hydrolase family protein [Pseudomonadota bacterium]
MSDKRITQEMIDLYNDFAHRTLDRRGFMNRLAVLAGGTAAAYAIAPLMEANQAQAAMIDPADPRAKTEDITFGTGVTGYLAWPASASGKLPTIVVVHENRGLNDHIRDVARRAALEGFVALAPDFLSPNGGTPSDPDAARNMFQGLSRDSVIASGRAAVAYLKGHAASNGKVGAMGFCWGGGAVNQIAINEPDLLAAAPFYGPVPDAADAAKIKAKMMLHYAGSDNFVNPGIPGYREALDKANVNYVVYMYEGASHAFHNDTAGARYNKEAAELAWGRTISFMKANLG